MLWCKVHREAWSHCECAMDTAEDAIISVEDPFPPEDPPATEYRGGAAVPAGTTPELTTREVCEVMEAARVAGMVPELGAPYGTSPGVPEGQDPYKFAANTILDRSNTPADDVLPNDSKARKAVPAGAVLDYFDSAWVEIAKALQDGNDQHNPGERLHWSRGKSSDHEHCIIRHYLQRGKLSVSPTGAVIRHSTYMAIRALMFLQEELEAAGAPLSRGSVAAPEKAK